MDTNSLVTFIQDIFSSNDIQIDGSENTDKLIEIVDNYGVDLSSYSPDEISEALKYALNDDSNMDSYNSQTNISFGNSQDSLERELRQENRNIDYYEKELRRTNISETYRNNCLFKLQKAVKNATELAEEINKLKK